MSVRSIVCSNCGHAKSSVLDSRVVISPRGVKRRRKCKACDHVYNTMETLETGADIKARIPEKHRLTHGILDEVQRMDERQKKLVYLMLQEMK